MDQEILTAPGRMDIECYLLWQGLTPLRLHHALISVLETDLRVGSPAAVE